MSDYLYAITGEDLFLIEDKVTQIISNLNVEPFNVITYDLSETDVFEFIEEIMTVSLLSDEKVIKVKNPWFFYEKRTDDLTPLIQYFKNPKEDTTLIFIIDKPINETLEISKEAKKYIRFEGIEVMKKDEYEPYIKSYFNSKGYKIEDDAIKELLERVNFQLHLMHKEIEKLELFAYDNKKIDLKDIKMLVPRNLEDNIFELTNAIIARNKKRMLEIYYDLLVKNEDSVNIISRIASEFKQLITTKRLLEKGYRQHEIKDYFDVSTGKAFYIIKNANGLNSDVLNKYYESLSNLDFEIKSGAIDKKLGLELWLLKVIGGEYDIK